MLRTTVLALSLTLAGAMLLATNSIGLANSRFEFSPLASSAVCTPGGNATAPFALRNHYTGSFQHSKMLHNRAAVDFSKMSAKVARCFWIVLY